VEQLKTEIASLHATPMSSDMETDAKHYTATTNHHPITPDLPALIAELKHDIATMVLEL